MLANLFPASGGMYPDNCSIASSEGGGAVIFFATPPREVLQFIVFIPFPLRGLVVKANGQHRDLEGCNPLNRARINA